MRFRCLASRSLLVAAVAASAVLGAGCHDTRFLEPGTFESFRGTAQIVVSSAPANAASGQAGFGAVLVGYQAQLPDSSFPTRFVRASRFAVSAGINGPYYGYRVFDESVLDLRATSGLRVSVDAANARFQGCADEFCGPGSSTSIAAFPVWRRGETDGTFGFACVAVPSGNGIVDTRIGSRAEQFQVRCETRSMEIQTIGVVDQGIRLGASASALPADHPLGAALFGAPGAASGDGGLYRLDDFPTNGLVAIPIAGVPNGAAIGETLASTTMADGSVLVATGGMGRREDALVTVLSISAEGATTLHACLRGSGSRTGTFGNALAFGDFNGDGFPDLVVGAGDRAPMATASVDLPIQLYDGRTLSAAVSRGCEDPPREPIAPSFSFDCPNGTAGLACGNGAGQPYAAFGASLAVGDVDADGIDDLIVGAPQASVRVGGGGAVVVVGGARAFDNLGTERGVLTYSSLRAGARLGAAVATTPGEGRDEIVAGAPGSGSAVIFFCSGIPGDLPADFAGMPGVTHGCVAPPMPRGDVDAGLTPTDGGVPRVDAGGPDADGADAGSDIDAAVDVDADVDSGRASDIDADVDAAP